MAACGSRARQKQGAAAAAVCRFGGWRAALACLSGSAYRTASEGGVGVKRILLIVAMLAIASCNSSPPTVTPAPTTESTGPATPDPGAVPLSLVVTNSVLAVGQERISFRIYDSEGAEIVGDSYEVEVNLYLVDTQTSAHAPVAGGPALYFGIPIADGSAWVVYSDFDASGPWALEALVSGPGGWSGTGWADLEVAGPTAMPRVGDRASIVDTPTAQGDDLSSVTSDADPDPDLYSLSLADAIATQKPTVVLFGSPEHCASDVCRATLDEMKDVKQIYGSQANFIHVETHDLSEPDQMTATFDEWHLPTEPWTFVFDDQGRIQARVEGPLDSTELELLVKRALGIPQ